MAKRAKAEEKVKKPLDAFSEKPLRGRPRKAIPSETRGRADNYRFVLDQVWDRLWPLLSQAQTEKQIVEAFEQGARTYAQEFMPHRAALILKVIRERRFPERRASRIGFLADSMAALGRVSPRRSRDICANERAKEHAKSRYKIIRREYYVECECGYKGPARDNACRKCGAQIPTDLSNVFFGNPCAL